MRLFALFALFSLACGGLAPKRANELLDDVRAYNDGIRWHKHAQAAARLAPLERDSFLEERAELEEDLRIGDYELVRVHYGGDRNHAIVHVKWTWHLDSRGLVRKTTSRQEWQKRGKVWILTDERRLRGEPMPGLPEPPEEGEEEGEEDRGRGGFAMP